MASTWGAQTLCGAPSEPPGRGCHRRENPSRAGWQGSGKGLGGRREPQDTAGGFWGTAPRPFLHSSPTPPGRGLSSAESASLPGRPQQPREHRRVPGLACRSPPLIPRRRSSSDPERLLSRRSGRSPCLPPSLRRRGNAGDPRTGSGSSAPPLLRHGVRNEPEPPGLFGPTAPRRDGRTHRHSHRRPARCPAVLPPLRAPPRLCRAGRAVLGSSEPRSARALSPPRPAPLSAPAPAPLGIVGLVVAEGGLRAPGPRARFRTTPGVW